MNYRVKYVSFFEIFTSTTYRTNLKNITLLMKILKLVNFSQLRIKFQIISFEITTTYVVPVFKFKLMLSAFVLVVWSHCSTTSYLGSSFALLWIRKTILDVPLFEQTNWLSPIESSWTKTFSEAVRKRLQLPYCGLFEVDRLFTNYWKAFTFYRDIWNFE